MRVLKKAGVIGLWLLLILATAIVTAAIKQSSADGPNRVFSGGALVTGELYSGVEPDWSFVNDIDTLELQLLNPEQSRRIWTASVDGKIYVWSGYMNSMVGKLWKSWPAQAEQDGRAVVRIDGVRYERELVRVKSGAGLEALIELMNEKYGSAGTPAAIDSGDLWMFEAAPRATEEAQ
ncbi:MAG: hypothetical protein P8N51_18000 [Pseudomonadales bacterium]|nr:hypothetical protein [Pseudomonadales bacterium]